MPESFEEQARLIWKYIELVLKSADMDFENIINLRFFLASPEYDEPNMRIRKEFLGEHRTSLTTICCQLLESSWKLEIEAIAAK